MTLLKEYPFLADKNEQNKLVSIGMNGFYITLLLKSVKPVLALSKFLSSWGWVLLIFQY